MKRLLLISILILTSCGDDSIVPPDWEGEATIQLKVGQSLSLFEDNPLEVGFEEVLQDSRCPLDVFCFWEGVAELRLWLLTNGRDSVFITSRIYGYVTAADTAAHKSIDTIGYRVTTMQLDPYPKLDVPTEQSSYKVLIRISKL